MKIMAGIFGLAVAAAIIAGAANGQGKSCCNLDTGQFEANPDCSALPNAIDVANNTDIQALQKARVCFQNVQEQAQEMLQDQTIPGLPPAYTLPGMTPVDTGPDTYACCNTASGAFAGEMTPDACRAEGPDFVPDLPENLSETEICRANDTSDGGGGSGTVTAAWNVDDYEPNISNGGMEDWRGERKLDAFGSHSIPEDMPRSYPIEIQTAFRSTDAHTGNYSLRLKNQDIASQLPPQAAAYLRAMNYAIPAGVFSCKEPCPADRPMGGMGAGAADIFFSMQAADIQSHVCGAYKGYIGASDELQLQVVVSGGGQQFSAAAREIFTRSSSDWVEFAIPLSGLKGDIPESGKAGIAAQIMARGSNGMGWGSSLLTEVWVDSIHFCSPMGITAYHPELIAKNSPIAENIEESEGVQTFVNHDNDDGDGFYDHEDGDGVEGDNELVRIHLELPMNSFGEVELVAPNIGSAYQIWQDAGKKTKFGDANTRLEVAQLLRANATGTKFERDLWVEALVPSETPRDQTLEFVFANKLDNMRETRDAVSLTMLALKQIEWRGQKLPDGGIEPFERDPNAPDWDDRTGWRAFPGKQWDGDEPEAEARKLVMMRAELNVAPVRPVDVYFRRIDVDDPSASGDEVDMEDSENDNRSEPGAWGFTGDTHEYTRVTFQKEPGKEIEFRLPMQPGDNFLIIGGPDIMTLMELANDDGKLVGEDVANGYLIHDPDVLDAKGAASEAEIPRAEETTSDVVTVWRRLYVEVDKMAPVQGNLVKSEIVAVRNLDDLMIDEADDSGTIVPTRYRRQWVKLNTNFYNRLPEEAQTGLAGLEDNYKPGGMYLKGAGNFDIRGSTAHPSSSDEVLIYHKGDLRLPVDDVIGMEVEIRDDDKFVDDGAHWPDLDLALLREEMAGAYVHVDEMSAPNPRRSQPFLINSGGDDRLYLKRLMDKSFDNKAHHNEPDIWVAFILDAFQGALDEDGDGPLGGAIAGQTDGGELGERAFGVVLYYESGRELAASNPSPGYQRDASVVHEIGHIFGAPHSHAGVMRYGTDAEGNALMTPRSKRYAPETIDSIRSTINP